MSLKSFLLGLILIFVFATTSTAFAMTDTERTALITQLQAQIVTLTQQLSELLSQQQQGATTTTTWCHTFNTSLGYSNSGSIEVSYLHIVLQKENISYSPDAINTYSSATAKAVAALQSKYGIEQTGYVGTITRAKLNALYGCESVSETENNISCSSDSDCGTTGYIGSEFCSGGNIYKTYRTYTCSNGGTSSSYCQSATTDNLIETCSSSQTCTNGSCVAKAENNISCSSDSDCGTSNYTGLVFCSNDDVYQTYRTYTCSNAGTTNSYCLTTNTDKLITGCTSSQICSSGSCSCKPSWSCGSWSTCSNNTQTRTCTDANSCGTTSNKPTTSQTCTSTVNVSDCSIFWWLDNTNKTCATQKTLCGSYMYYGLKTFSTQAECLAAAGINSSCTEKWSCGSWSSCVLGSQTRTCTDANSCGTTSNKPATSQTCTASCTSSTCNTITVDSLIGTASNPLYFLRTNTYKGSYTMVWYFDNADNVVPVNIYLLNDDNKEKILLAQGIKGDAEANSLWRRYYNWSVSNNLVSGSKYRIYIESVSAPNSIYAYSEYFPIINCIDSDNYLYSTTNYYNQGIVKGALFDNFSTTAKSFSIVEKQDYCRGSVLIEYYCSDKIFGSGYGTLPAIRSEEKDCGGYGCSNGRCKQEYDIFAEFPSSVTKTKLESGKVYAISWKVIKNLLSGERYVVGANYDAFPSTKREVDIWFNSSKIGSSKSSSFETLSMSGSFNWTVPSTIRDDNQLCVRWGIYSYCSNKFSIGKGIEVTANILVNGSSNVSNLNVGDSATLTWSSTNATSCTASGDWSGIKAVSGSQSTGAVTSNKAYKITCKDLNGNTASSSVGISFAQPSVSILINESASLSATDNASKTITWSSTNATSCTASGDWSGTKATSGTESTGTLLTDKTYKITCSGSGGSISATATVTLPKLSFNFTAKNANGDMDSTWGDIEPLRSLTVPYNSPATLTWSSTNATSCTASGDWSGTKATSGTESTGNIALATNPVQTQGQEVTVSKTYKLACQDSNGKNQEATIRITATRPDVYVRANNRSEITVPYNSSITLTWGAYPAIYTSYGVTNTINPTSCYLIWQGSGSQQSMGSSLSPFSSKTVTATTSGSYTFGCTYYNDSFEMPSCTNTMSADAQSCCETNTIKSYRINDTVSETVTKCVLNSSNYATYPIVKSAKVNVTVTK